MPEIKPTASTHSRVMKWVRWIHGYLGLFLIPWILLYGVTGFLFNHYGAFADHEVRRVDLKAGGTTLLSSFPSPDSAAAMTLRAYAEKTGKTLKPAPELRARYTEPAYFSVRNGSKDYDLTANMTNGSGLVHAYFRPAAPPLAQPTWFELQDSLKARGAFNVGRIITDTPITGVKWDQGPLLRFNVLLDGAPFSADYDIGQAKLRLSPEKGWPASISFRQFLLSLHTHRAYPISPGVETLWALFVDITAISMVLWALTGLLLWYQRRNTRLSGLAVLLISVLSGLGLGCWMWELFRRM
jgi:hypothetical protein